MLFDKKQQNNTLCAFALHEEGVTFIHAENNADKKPDILNFEILKGEIGVQPLLLKTLDKKFKLKKTPCAICLPHNDYQLIVCDAPEVPEKDLIDALHWEIKDLVDLPIEELTLDTFSIPDQTTTKQSLNVVAARKTTIVQLDNLFSEAKLSLEIIDIEEMALRNLAIYHETSDQGQVVLWLNEKYGKILFIKNKNIHLSRHIEMGESNLNNSISGMESIALEIQRSLDYFERHYSQTAMHKLVVMPLQNPSEEFVEYLNNNLSIQSTGFAVKSVIDGLDHIDDLTIANNVIPLGTALRQNIPAI